MGLFTKRKKPQAEEREVTQTVQTYLDNAACALNYGSFDLTRWGALNIGTFFSCLQLLSGSIAMLPVKVLDTSHDGATNEATNHTLSVLFSGRNNKMRLSTFAMLKQIIVDVVMRGNAFVYVERGKDGEVTNLRYLEPSQVVINYDVTRDVLSYTVTMMRDGKQIYGPRKVEPVNMLHFAMWRGRDAVTGVSLLNYARRAIRITGANEDAAEDFFAKGLNVSGYLSSTTPISQKQKKEVSDAWTQAYSAGGSGVAVLNSNLAYHQLSINPSDAQLLESREYGAVDICRWFGINPALVGAGGSGVSYTSLSQLVSAFLVFTLQPWITMIEDELNRKLLRPSESDLSICLDEEELLRADKSAQSTYYRTMVETGILSINEVRRMLGYQPIEGLDKHTIAYTDVSMNTLDDANKNSDKDE